MTPSLLFRRLCLSVAVTASLSFVSTSQAQTTFTYTGGGIGTSATPVNGFFSSGFTPTLVGSSTAELTFTGANSYTAVNDLSSALSLLSLAYSGSGSVTIARGNGTASNRLSFGSNSAMISATGIGTLEIDSDISLTSSLNTSGKGTILLTGTISGFGSFNPIGSGVVTTTGIVSNTTGQSIGNGTFNLNGTYTGTGQTAVYTHGTFNINSADYTNTISIEGGITNLNANLGGSLAFSSHASLALLGGAFNVIGSNTGNTTQTLSSFFAAQGTASTLSLTSGQDHNATVTLGAISGAGTGSALNINTTNLGTGLASFTTTTANNSSGLLGHAIYNGVTWATVSNGTIQGLTNYSSGFSVSGSNVDVIGTQVVSSSVIAGSLRFNNASGAVKIPNGASLTLVTGGILMTNSAGVGDTEISGGSLISSAGNLL